MLLKKSYAIIVILLIALFYSNGFALTNKSADFCIKDGTTLLNTTVFKILPWGIVIDSNKTVLYRVISTMRTNDKSLVDSVIKHVDSLRVGTDGDIYVVSFEKASIKFNPQKINNTIKKDCSFYISYNPINYENCEYGMLIYPKFIYKYLYLHINTTFNFSNVEENYSAESVFLGAGLFLDTPYLTLLFGLNAGYKTIQYPPVNNKNVLESGQKGMAVFYPEVMLKVNLFSERFCGIVSMHTFSNNFSIKDNVDKFAINLGIGINF